MPASLTALHFRGLLRLSVDHLGEGSRSFERAICQISKDNLRTENLACGPIFIHQMPMGFVNLKGLKGGSNGGLLMGAMITQHPDLMKAVVSEAGLYDVIRSELWPNGLFNTTEYGGVKDPEQFKALLAYSPYHHVVNGTKYPAILLTAGLNDGRVAPYNSFKFAARLQAASTSGHPLLLRVNSFGHGFGSSLDQKVSDLTDVFSFFAYELGAQEGTQKVATKRP